MTLVPRFNLKTLLAATAMVALGCYGFTMWLPDRFVELDSFVVKLISASLAWTCFLWMGAGIGLLFQNPSNGILVGIVLQALLAATIGHMR